MDQALRFRKLTGPIEHWLTTYHQGYWGFRPDKQEAWENINVDDVFVFHASASELLELPRGALTDIETGIIGLGRVGAKSTKNEPVWWEELYRDGDYPYLIHFSEIYWFGNTDQIRDVSVEDKDLDEMIADIHNLAENMITFREMRNRTDYQIPPQGSPTNISSPEKLFPLFRERIEGGIASEDVEERNSESTPTIRERTRDRNLNVDSIDVDEITYTPSIQDTIAGTIDHEKTLDRFEDFLSDREFEGGELDHSDLLMQSDEHVVLGEAKMIHANNESTQIRRGLGQLLEYRHRDILQNLSWPLTR